MLCYSCSDHDDLYDEYVSIDIDLLINKYTLPYNHYAHQYDIEGYDLNLLIILDSRCKYSVLEIIFWRDMISKWNLEDNLGFVFMLQGNVDLYMMHIILNRDIIAIPVYIDNDNYIAKNHNNLIDFGNVLLANSKNKIIFIGNPYQNENDLDKLFSIIKRKIK